MNFHHYQTGRGFTRIDFADHYGNDCSLQESSLATEECIWLGRGDERMHLTREQVAELMPLLEFFVGEGRLPESGDEP